MARSTVLKKSPERPVAEHRAAVPIKSELLLFTATRPRWSIIGALSVMTLDWQDF